MGVAWNSAIRIVELIDFFAKLLASCGWVWVSKKNFNTNYIWIWWDDKKLILVLYFENVRQAVYHADREFAWCNRIDAWRIWRSQFYLKTQAEYWIAYY